MSDESIRELPIVKTVVTSMQTNSTVKQVLKLGCSVLIKYSRFRTSGRSASTLACCVRDFYSLNVVPYLCTQITRLASESVLSMELAVIAAYGMNSLGFWGCVTKSARASRGCGRHGVDGAAED